MKLITLDILEQAQYNIAGNVPLIYEDIIHTNNCDYIVT
jgi:hypothetical protein